MWALPVLWWHSGRSYLFRHSSAQPKFVFPREWHPISELIGSNYTISTFAGSSSRGFRHVSLIEFTHVSPSPFQNEGVVPNELRRPTQEGKGVGRGIGCAHVDCGGLGTLRNGVRTVDATLTVRRRHEGTAATRHRALSGFANYKNVGRMLDVKASAPVPNAVRRTIGHLLSILSGTTGKGRALCERLLRDLGSSMLATFCAPAFLVRTMTRRVGSAFATGSLGVNAFLRPSTNVNNFLPIKSVTARQATFRGSLLAKLMLSTLRPSARMFVRKFRAVSDRRARRGHFSMVTSGVPFNSFHIFSGAFDGGNNVCTRTSGAVRGCFFLGTIRGLGRNNVLTFIASENVTSARNGRFIHSCLMRHYGLVATLHLPSDLFVRADNVRMNDSLLVFRGDNHGMALASHRGLFVRAAQRVMPNDSRCAKRAGGLFALPGATLFARDHVRAGRCKRCIHGCH